MFDRHVEVLHRVAEEEPIGIVNLSDDLGFPRHKIRYSLRVLQEASVIEPTARGATTADGTGDAVADYAERIDSVIDQLEDLQ